MANDYCILTVKDALLSKVRFEVPEEVVETILIERSLDGNMAYVDVDKMAARLAYADILKWFLLGPSKVNNTSDTDNGWSHTTGGYELTTKDKNELKAEANAIYKELEPTSMFKSRTVFKIQSFGIQRAERTFDGQYMPHIIH